MAIEFRLIDHPIYGENLQKVQHNYNHHSGTVLGRHSLVGFQSIDKCTTSVHVLQCDSCIFQANKTSMGLWTHAQFAKPNNYTLRLKVYIILFTWRRHCC